MTMTTLIADIALAVTVVLGLGSVAALVLRKGSPALRHAAWRATLAGVWLAPLAVVAAGMLPVQRPEIAVPVPRFEPAPAPLAEAPPAPVEEPMASILEVAPAPAPREPLPGAHALSAILLSLWGAGALVAFLAFARDANALRTLLAEGAPGDRPATVEAIAQRLGLARLPRVRRSAEVSVPAVAGWLRPTLVLPEGGRADEAALIHELAHVQRGDVPTLTAARLTAALWWWHPLAWLMLRGLAATAEEACDDVVLALTGARREYAQMLADWAERATVAGAVNCGSRGKGLVARVRRVLDEHVRPVTRLSGTARVAVMACALVAVMAAGAFGVRTATLDANGITTVLLTGVDARPGNNDRGRADAMMVLFVNPETDRAALLSLPRDLRVPIPSHGMDKLNSAFAYGGPELARETVEAELGITIDHSVQLDMWALPEVIDALGGVTVDVPDVEGRGRGMNYDDNWGDLHIHLAPGMQHLDGEQALGFVTYRKGDSDFARQKRQQQLLRALLEQKGADLVKALPSLLDAVRTDLGASEAVALARELREMPEEGLLATDMTEYLRDLNVGGIYFVEASDADIATVLAQVEEHLGGEIEAAAGPDEGFSLAVTGPDGETIFTAQDAVYFLLVTNAATPIGQPLRDVGEPIIAFGGELPAGVKSTDTRLRLDGETVGFTQDPGMPRGYVAYRMSSATPAQREALLRHFGWGETPQPVPGTGRIEVRARFGDGSQPMPAACVVFQDTTSPRIFEPDIVGADGDWTVYNVPPGEWQVALVGPGFPNVSPLPPDGGDAKLRVNVTAGATEEVSVTLSRGGTVEGTVIAPDGQIPEGLSVRWQPGEPQTTPVAPDGSYRIEHVRPRNGLVYTSSTSRYVSVRTPHLTVREEDVTTAPPLELERGGWIAGYIVGGPEGEDMAGWAYARPQMDELPWALVPAAYGGGSGPHFRIGPLIPGEYRVEAIAFRWPRGETTGWSAMSETVTVEVGETVDVGTIELRQAAEELRPIHGFLPPVDGRLTSAYGYRVDPITGQRRFHTGIDLAAPEGTPIVAAADGTVIYAGWKGAYGQTVMVDHGDEWATMYAHCSEILVENGQRVARGELIAKVGSTGFATGPQLQWTVYHEGATVDPLEAEDE